MIAAALQILILKIFKEKTKVVRQNQVDLPRELKIRPIQDVKSLRYKRDKNPNKKTINEKESNTMLIPGLQGEEQLQYILKDE